MTDTGRVPGEGQPGHADEQPEAQQPQPTAAAHGAYAYADPEADQPAAGDDEDLLMPGVRSGWSDGQSASGQYAVRSAQQQPVQGGQATAQAGAPRRPLHLGPPVPEQSGAVRTLADRGPSTPPPAQAQAAPVPAQQHGPDADAAAGPEYLDVPHQDAEALPGPQLGELPAQQEGWTQATPSVPQPPVAEPVDQATVAPLPGPDLAAAPHPVPEPDPKAPHSGPDVVSDPAAATPQPDAEPGAVPVPAAPVAQPQPPADAQPVTAETVPEATPPHGEAVPSAAATGTATAEPAAPAPTAHPEQAESLPEPTTDASPAGAATDPADDAALAASAPEEPAGTDVADASPGTGRPGDTGAGPDRAAEAVPPEESETAPEPAGAVPPPAAVAEQGDAVPASQEESATPEPQPEQADAASEPRPADGDVPNASPEAVTVPGPREPSGPVEATPVAGQPAQDTADTPQPVVAAPDGEAPEPEASAVMQPDATVPAADAEDAAPGPGEPEPAFPEQAAPPISDGTASDEAAPAHDDAAGEETPAPPTEPEPPEPATAPAPGYDEADREAVHRLMRERRDIRNGFRPDPIPHDVLLRVLEAAHTAPSVGHSQPWDFVVIRSEETRRTMHELAMKQREAYAKSLPKARAKQFKELKVEAILDTPVNIVVTADPTRGGRHTLGRQTQPQMAPYSSALAVENLWLAARAEGLGVGWVSFFDEREMVRTLDLPEHLEVVAYLCIGYVDEFPAEPELMQAGWSKRRPLSWVVHEESYGRRALPGAEPHDLLAETLERIRPLDAKALGEAWERQKRMTKPAGALGMLEIISAQLCGLSRQCPPPVPEPAAVAVFAGDHGVHAQGVTPWPQEVTAQMVANFLGGGAVCNAFAHQVGAEVCIIDVGVSAELPATPGLLPRKVRPGTADMTRGPALTQEEVLRAIEVGIETARDLVAAGNKALVTGEMGIANTTASAALIAACTGSDPAEVTGRGTGIDDETHTRKIDVVRRALELHRPDPADPVGMLAAIGGLEHAALAGLILGGASLRTPVILDGVSAGAAALVARQIAPEALAACIAGHRSAEPGHVAALTKLGLRPLIDLDLRLGEGTGALLALPMVQSAARAMHEVATFDSAGVTEKG